MEIIGGMIGLLVLGALIGFLGTCWLTGKIDEEIERERLWKHKGKVYRLTPIE